MRPDPDTVERDALLDFVQRVAASRRAICKADHHAGTCRGAVGLADEAAKLLASLGIEPRAPVENFRHSCALCGDDEYVLGDVWNKVWVHRHCLPVQEESA